MSRIKGISIMLYEKRRTGTDEANAPIYKEIPVTVDNVLIGSPSSQDQAETTALYKRMAQYQLAIPKGDEHDWENVTVEFFGQKWKTVGIPVEGIEDMLPLDWNKKVWVEKHE